MRAVNSDQLIGEKAYRQLAATGYQDWLDHLPHLVSKASQHFGVEVTEPLEGGSASCALKVIKSEELRVMKLQPGNTLFYQAIAYANLEDQKIAPKLIAHSPSHEAILIEYLEGETTAKLSVEEVVELHRKLQVTPQGLQPLAVITQKWLKTAQKVRGLPRDFRKLLSLMPLLIDIHLHRQERSLLHTDFKPEHILKTEKGLKVLDIDGGWGNPAFDLGSMGFLMEDLSGALERIEKMAALTGISEEELAAWGSFRGVMSGVFAYGRGEEEKAFSFMQAAMPLLDRARIY